MENRPTGAGQRSDRRRHRSTTYQLKVELRRLERADRGDSDYAKALRRVLRACAEHDPESVLRVLEDEVRRLEADNSTGDGYTTSLRRAISLLDPEEQSDHQLFTYYLRKMEQDGRGDEPFARALRRALHSPDGPSLEKLLIWREQEGGT